MEMEKDSHRLKLATFNVRTDTPDDGPEGGPYRWSSRFPIVMKTIETYQWDIIGFQEVQEKQLKDLLKQKKYAYVGEKRGRDEFEEYNPIFYRKSRFTLINSDTFWLSDTPDKLSRAYEWGASAYRICTIARLKCIQTENEFMVINTHFDHISEIARYKSAILIMNKIKKDSEDLPIFFMGDFNGDERERWYKEVNREMTNAVSISEHHVGPLVTCTGVAFSYLPTWDDMQYIDYIFINDKVRVLKTTIATDRYGSYYPSDHFPVSLECCIE